MTELFHANELVRIGTFVIRNEPLDEYGCNQLHYCVSLHSPSALKISLKRKTMDVDVNAFNLLGETPLIRALHLTNIPSVIIWTMIDILIRHGADPNLRKDTTAPTPLMLAVIREDVELVRRLLEAGAHVNARIDANGLLLKQGDSALSLAVKTLPITAAKEAILSLLLGTQGISPSIIFHALQQTPHPALKHFLLHGNLNVP